MTQRTISEGYLYNLWNGKLKELKGEVRLNESYVLNDYIIPEKTYFLLFDEHGRIVKKMQCSKIEGELYNKVVWLKEANRDKANKILIEYEEQQISELEFRIRNHEELIKVLKGEL